MYKNTLLLFLLLICASITKSQSVVGAWKTVSNVLEESNGTKKDMLAMQLKLGPCMAQLQTVFEANGKQVTKSPAACGPIDYNKLPPSTWKMQGNTISITNTSLPTPLGTTATYKVEFSGNKAVFTHDYSDEERKKLRSKNVKRVVITYERI